MTAESTNVPDHEPKPGEWISPGEFANVIRLTPLVAIDLIVQDANHRVLVGRRLNEPARGFLFVPGSRISKNETRAMAFERITREELGVTVPLEQHYPTSLRMRFLRIDQKRGHDGRTSDSPADGSARSA